MKKVFLLALISLFTLSALADNAKDARKVLDKTASVIGKKSGAQADFRIKNGKIGSTSGTIAIKGNKFNARTPQATVWFNGKTQWTYMKDTDEVNITTPTQAQQAHMNPLTFINMYKTGYNLSMKTVYGKKEVRMQAQNKGYSIQEMYIVINPKTFIPTQVRMRQKDSWTIINISNFKATPQKDSTFIFNKKDYPSAEVVDLR
jgi:outer membrane lipoprotein-sorting protein